ncbi:hypothetical protein [Campylobacter corcagiensis]|uniref:3-isopropylmalate dehydratase n=1 Tax=Campylobacter corcagiensis TaxID=1448857 RepID=A0A7M1LEF1_9BACT|nr:hypothetical protein [Campylobacter corcagiensis]QKF65016.1 putative membrane protein [Campylobacter corcagiensis]QOQ86830.1 hypothetical protein IMC76_06330 [Campylobacter corcagiensis]
MNIDASFARVEHILPFLHLTSLILLMSVQLSLVMVTNFFIKKTYKVSAEFFRQIKVVLALLFGLLFAMVMTGYFLSLGGDFKFSDPMVGGIINTKYALTFLITCNMIYVGYRFYLAKKAYKASQIDEMIEHIIIATRYFVILDVILLFIGVYLGIVIRSFG